MDGNLQVNGIEALVKSKYTTTDFINYYKNVWQRNAIARAIDMQEDIALIAKSPKKLVRYMDADFGTVSEITVEERLELRKSDLEQTLRILEAIKVLEAETPEQHATRFTPEFLAPTPAKPEEKKEEAKKEEAKPETTTDKVEEKKPEATDAAKV